MTYLVRAKNTSVASDNKIHDDAVARAYGFSGGLVPGVDVYAYLTHGAVEKWGIDWLERGTFAGRFSQPVYDGETVALDTTPATDGVELTLTGEDGGAVRATATATLPDTSPPAPDPDDVPTAALPDAPVPASPTTLAPGTLLGTLRFGFHADKAQPYLDDIRETSPLYREAGVAHPGWLLRSANFVLTANVKLGPWIHVSSETQHHSTADDGDDLSTRAWVIDRFERKGHQFVTLDVLIVANDVRPVARVRHTAIYQPRQKG
jgi:acyl dehydratase